MTVSDAAALADELHAFCAAAPHDYPGHNIELFERVESFLRTLIPSDSASDAALAGELLGCPFCGGKAELFDCEETDNIGGRAIACTNGLCRASTNVIFGLKENPDPLLIERWNTRTPIPVAVSRPAEDQIKHMVDRFLGWKLPENFSPDAGISFKAAFNEHTAHPMKHEPSGTNLFDATQADAMVRYMIAELPLPAVAVSREEVARIFEEYAFWDEFGSYMKDELLDAILSLPLQLHDRAAGVEETFVIENPDGSISLDAYAGKSREELKEQCGDLAMALGDWQFAAMSAATDDGNSIQNVREPYRSKISKLIEAYSDEETPLAIPAKAEADYTVTDEDWSMAQALSNEGAAKVNAILANPPPELK